MILLLRASVWGGEHAATRATRDGADGSVQGSAGPDHQPGARVGTARPRHRPAGPGEEAGGRPHRRTPATPPSPPGEGGGWGPPRTHTTFPPKTCGGARGETPISKNSSAGGVF